MIDNKRVVLVLGAGASMDDQFPSGAQLVDRIITLVQQWEEMRADHSNHVPGRAWHDIAHMMRETKVDFGKICQLRALLESAPVQSIDYLLGKRTEFINEGKFLIAYILIGHENPVTLNHFSRRGASWYQYLWNMLETEHADDFRHNRLRVITYNYDRSFEYFLRRAMIDVYDLSDQRANAILESIPVIHLHGALGTLAVEARQGGRAYTTIIDEHAMREAMNGIRVIHEHEDHRSDGRFIQAREILDDAEIIFLLGFGYNAVNVRRLELHKYPRVVGTTLGFTDAEVDTIKKKLVPNLFPSPKTIYQFLRDIGLEWSYS